MDLYHGIPYYIISFLLLDSGCIYFNSKGKLIKNMHTFYISTRSSTQAGNIMTISMVKVDFCLPELSQTKTR